MKRFSDIPSVVHAFAHQTYPECGTYNGNVWYERDVIYSYGPHFPMGRLLGDDVVLLTTRTYSNSTSNHQRKLRQAVNHMERHYCEDPRNPLGREAVFQTICNIEAFLQAAAKRRSPELAERDLMIAQTAFDEIEWIRSWEKKHKKTVEQCRDWRPWSALPSETKTAWTGIKKILAAAAVDIKSAASNVNAAQAKAKKRRQLAQQRANKEATAQAKKALAEWQHSGNRIAGFHGIKQFLGHDGLRFVRRTSADKSPDDMVGTTQGLYVPAEDCRKAWPLIKAAYAKLDETGIHVDFSSRVQASARLGDFAPTGILRDGKLIVGCHAFTRDSVENLAEALGLN